ncbi:hypothetical protein [Rhodoblastus sp.]|uniref:hypothetical protein n=1 Tax=Rhodoblastus sp. TaxID=1962975 RepID=UPI003F9917EF
MGQFDAGATRDRVRAKADHCRREEFQDLLRCVATLSQKPRACGWVGDHGVVRGVVKRIEMFARNSTDLFGPSLEIEARISELTQGRVLERRIFTECFRTANDFAEKPKNPLFERL